MPGFLGAALDLDFAAVPGSCSSAEPLAQTALVPHMHVGTAPSAAGLLMRSATSAHLQNTCGRDNQAPSCTLQGFPEQCAAEAPRSSSLLHARIGSTAAATAPSGQNKRGAYQFPGAAHLPVPGLNKLRHVSTILATAARQAQARLRSQLPKLTLSIHGGLPDKCEGLLR